MMKRFYLAYGSNLNLQQMKLRCRNAKVIGTMILNDYRLCYKGSSDGFAYLTVEANEGSYVPLGIYEISFLDEIFLDQYEGYPTFYCKKYITIDVNGKKKKSLIYVMNEGFDHHIPAESYVNTCMEGYCDFGFDSRLLEEAFRVSTENVLKKTKKS